MPQYQINVNGQKKTVDVAADTPLLWVLRDTLSLQGTKYGCGIAHCGACTIHVDGVAVRSCSYPVQSLNEQKITTIEGLSSDGSHPVQKAWDTLDVPQCGYCQAGQIMTAAAFIANNKNPKDDEISMAMSGNICRCGTYHRIKDAVKLAAKLSKS